MRQILQKSLLLMICFFSCLAWAQAQERVVTGKVTFGDGITLPGAVVQVKDSSIGTVTDSQGEFSLKVPDGAETTLIFSFLGYVTQQVPIGSRSTVDIILQEDDTDLQEVVVIGYGTQERREITSAVSSISEEEFNRGNVNNPLALMQGKIPGLSITSPGSNPNAAASVRLRGISTLGGNAEPLIVVDGVIGVPLNMVDPNDIQTIDVLKDASAAAIYGSRGASGVILITTKTGKPGEPRFEYNTYVSAEQVAHTLPVMNGDEYRALGIGEDFGANTNWFDEITRTAFSQAHNVALTGGTESTVYRASVNYRNIQGVAKNSGFENLNARLNLTQKALDNKLALTLNLMGTTRNAEGPISEEFGPFRYATTYNPTAPVRSDDPRYARYGGYTQQTLFDYFNPVAMLEQNQNLTHSTMFNMNLQAVYEPVDGLQFLARYSNQRTMTEQGTYTSKFSLGTGMDRNGMATRNENTNNNQLFEATATYFKDIGRLQTSLLVGYSYQEFLNNGFSLSAGNFLTDAFGYHNLEAALDFQNGLARGSSYQDRSKIIGLFGRLLLNYDNTYFFSGSLRREGSTMFGVGNQWGYFPAVSAGVELTQLMDLPRVDNLKLRASYGVTGNTPRTPYLSLQTMGPIGNFLYNGTWIPGYGPSSNPNPNLGWEQKTEFDIGLDFTGFNNRLTASFDYYNRNTTDLIYPITVPVPPNLVNETELNIGQINSSGLEAALSYQAVERGRFSWTTSINGAYYINNTLVSLSNVAAGLEFGGRRFTSVLGSPGLSGVSPTVVFEGQELGQIWGYQYLGIDDAGEWMFRDLDGSGDIGLEQDQTVIGNAFPDFQLGWGNSIRYGNFDLNFFFRGTFGHDLVNTNRIFYENTTGGSYNVVKTKYFNENLSQSPRMSDFYVESGDYLVLDNATLGYNFPVQSSFFSSFRLYLTGQNLFMITGYTGVDPEVRQEDPLAAGVEMRNSWFRSRTYTLGLNIGF